MADIVSLIDPNLTKAKPLPLLITVSLGMKEFGILPAMQNIASSFEEEIEAWRLDTNMEMVFSLNSRVLLGRGLMSPALLGGTRCLQPSSSWNYFYSLLLEFLIVDISYEL
ncbi:hypothetical protein AAC387_Pa03g1553 [Persea americana]